MTFFKSRYSKPDEKKLRPLGIMTINDRIMAKIVSFALTAKWGALLEPNIMGFRLGRNTQDAMERIYHELNGKDRVILDAVKKFLNRLKEIVWWNKQIEQKKFISKLNPVLRGWARYYRYSEANRAFQRVDFELWNLLWRWAKRRHPHKGKKWILNKYFGKVGDINWTFRDKKTGYSIIQVKDIRRLEYKFIVGTLSPYDPNPKVRKIWERKGYDEIKHAVTKRQPSKGGKNAIAS